jgi:hypothetical protein
VCAAAGLSRALWLSIQLSGFEVAEFGYLLLADVPVLGALTILMCLEAVSARALKNTAIFLTIALTAVYLLDVAAVMTLDARLQITDMKRFAGEWWVIPAFLTMKSLPILVMIALVIFVKLSVPSSVFRALPGIGLVFLLLPSVVPVLSIPSHLHKYTGSVLLLGKELWGARRQPPSRYNPSDVAAYRAEYDALFDVPVAASRKNIVVVIVESLSAADSYRTAGIRNALPRFDELSREGILFRNFFANFEASEGGIISILSGVPPLHFPTASTNTFAEYALQRSAVSAFSKEGYRAEFMTSVPLQFISMDAYATSPDVGFAAAGGQREIPRLAGAQKYGFESPSDRVLYEELLSRLDLAGGTAQPAFFVAVTASSHPPYVDPAGRANTEANVWSYVQEELWWLHQQLAQRRFFENGLLVITGDHRRMMPIGEHERARFGDSAKARVPLVIIGSGAPKDVIDDRLFQQSDLLRMLDKAVSPGTPLSPFAVWVERYVFVFGVASNASNLQVFTAHDGARRGHRLNLRGAEIEWVDRPGEARLIERSIHRQRASQQSYRMVSSPESVLNFGRDLQPSNRLPGMVVGLSADVDLGRDPDDPRGSLRTRTTDTFRLEAARHAMGGERNPFTMTVRAFLPVDQDGDYWFSLFADDEGCLAIDKQIVLNCQRGLNEGMTRLTAGVHRFDLRFAYRTGTEALRLRWLPPGAKGFVDFPEANLVRPHS